MLISAQLKMEAPAAGIMFRKAAHNPMMINDPLLPQEPERSSSIYRRYTRPLSGP